MAESPLEWASLADAESSFDGRASFYDETAGGCFHITRGQENESSVRHDHTTTVAFRGQFRRAASALSADRAPPANHVVSNLRDQQPLEMHELYRHIFSE